MNKQADEMMVTPAPNSESINQIREIIFGEHISSWEKKFKSLEKKLNELDRKIDLVQDSLKNANSNLGDELGKCNEGLSTEITKLQNEINKKLHDLEGNKVDKDSIGEVFIQWGQQVKTKTK